MTRLSKILKCVVSIACAVLIFIILFAPTSREPYMRNVPLLITLIIITIVVFVIKISRILFLVFRIKFSLIKCGFTSAKLRLGTECCYIYAEREGDTYEICAVVSKKYVRYHFESIEKIEIYKKYRDFAVSANRSGRAKVIKGPTRTEKIKEIHLRWSSENAQEVKRFVVFNKHPWRITDSKRQEELDDGVCICGSDITIYDAETFIKLISNE